jgi:hypothetical protein
LCRQGHGNQGIAALQQLLRMREPVQQWGELSGQGGVFMEFEPGDETVPGVAVIHCGQAM